MPTPAQRVILGILFAGVLVAALDIAIVGPALPAIRSAFDVGSRALSWVFSAYVLFYVVGAPLLAKLSDRTGRRLLPVPDDLALPAGEPSDDPRHRYTHLEIGPYTRLCEALRARASGRETSSPVPVPTFADGLACMRVLDAVRASAAAGGVPLGITP